MSMRTILLGAAFGVVGCLFTGDQTEGLPCNNHGECGLGLRCIERVCCRDEQSCDAHTTVATGATTEAEGSESGPVIPSSEDEGEIRETCETSDTVCLDEDVLRLCLEGKLQTLGCQGVCGPTQESLGCHHSSTSDRDGCFCGFEIEACTNEGAAQCDGGVGLQLCSGGTWEHLDCDDLCVDNGWEGASYCETGTCYCDSVCEEGASRCSNSSTNAVCYGGSWQSEGCTSICQYNGYEQSLGCFYYPDGDSGCYCI